MLFSRSSKIYPDKKIEGLIRKIIIKAEKKTLPRINHWKNTSTKSW